MQTIGSRLEMRRGVAPGFDFLRLFLAVSVVAWHSLSIGTGFKADDKQFLWVFGWSVLAAFFALSGFLISGSALRLSLPNFLTNRGLRIVPALAVEIILSALILGPLFTTLPLGAYFSSTQTWHYFTNIVGLVNYQLPGVFESNFETTVNTSIWTVPHELMCYMLISALIFTRAINKPAVISALVVSFIGLGIVLALAGYTDTTEGLANKVIYRLFIGPPARLYVFFLMGILFYVSRDKIPYSPPIFFASILVVISCGFYHYDTVADSPFACAELAIPLTYITAFIGVTDIWLPSALKKGDYSYGIYLYGWPFQQIVYSLHLPVKGALADFAFSMPLILAFSVISWHLIEKPILTLRKKFSFVARVRLGIDEQTPPLASELAVQRQELTRSSRLRA